MLCHERRRHRDLPKTSFSQHTGVFELATRVSYINLNGNARTEHSPSIPANDGVGVGTTDEDHSLTDEGSGQPHVDEDSVPGLQVGVGTTDEDDSLADVVSEQPQVDEDDTVPGLEVEVGTIDEDHLLADEGSGPPPVDEDAVPGLQVGVGTTDEDHSLADEGSGQPQVDEDDSVPGLQVGVGAIEEDHSLVDVVSVGAGQSWTVMVTVKVGDVEDKRRVQRSHNGRAIQLPRSQLLSRYGSGQGKRRRELRNAS
ncbi:uncharacterized protein LAESUDRAFT_752451 [Laetiporus sulphureus 93-53]|uniref:Uncharacterized protein n=1 Tax=Laetiporus sulphureus 93-53 TaxID=1314785 RepID=A0A165BYG8_9APHY|nr:uncharacterized protein LAESUDRAFT_752451 [Laetiporus sulphureus 93-53]KZT01878.1 hypothetical protein LAESUDRAFT_752451 [Laetiporus sulphureus 93-53]